MQEQEQEFRAEPAYLALMAYDAGYATGIEGDDDWQDVYLGEYDSLVAYADQWLEETGDLATIPTYLQAYFDVEAYARDLKLSGDLFTVSAPDYGVYVFRSDR